MRGRRELTSAVGGCVLAGALALATGGQSWAGVTVERRRPLPPVTEALTGSALAPVVPAAGLVLLAAAVALLAVRGRPRQGVGLLAALAGGALIWSALRPLVVDVSARDLADGTAVGATSIDVVWHAAWPVVAGTGGVVALVTGVFVLVRAAAWPSLGRRYERAPDPAAAGNSPADRTVDAWRALDRGEDPTLDDAPR